MHRARWRAPLALALTFGLATGVAACGDDDEPTTAGDTPEAVDGPTIRIAPQDFNESETLTEAYAQYLEAQGFDIDLQPANGFRDQVYPDLEGDDLDLIIDYTGSAAGFLDDTAGGKADADEAYTALQGALSAKELTAGAYSPAEDKNALVVLKSYAEEHGLTKISDLSKLEGTIKIGGAEDCRERTDCLLGYTDPAVYGLTMELTALDYGPALTAALESNTVQVAQYQTTAPELLSGKFVALEDDKGLLSADNIVPVLRADIADEYDGALIEALDELSSKLTTETLIEWNAATDIDKEEPADVARAWLEEEGLL